MDRFLALQAFVKAVDLASFVGASRALAVSASAVGKAVARLESELGVRLLHRTTRSIQLTDEGRAFYDRCRRILDDWDDAHQSLSQARREPTGRLSVCAPEVGRHFLMPLVAPFLARHPRVTLELVFTDRRLDLVEAGLDVAIRSGELPDSSLVCRPLHGFDLGLWAAPAYVAQRGEPDDPQRLQGHRAVRFKHPETGKLLDWPWPALAESAHQRPEVAMVCDRIDAVLDATRNGVGLACLPDFLVRDAVAAGALVRVLPASLRWSGRYQAVWPSSRHLPSRVRAWVDHLADHLAPSTAP